jgi:hypothetical protein
MSTKIDCSIYRTPNTRITPATNTRTIGAASNETPRVPSRLPNSEVVFVVFNCADDVREKAMLDAPTPVPSNAARTTSDVADLISPIIKVRG